MAKVPSFGPTVKSMMGNGVKTCSTVKVHTRGLMAECTQVNINLGYNMGKEYLIMKTEMCIKENSTKTFDMVSVP